LELICRGEFFKKPEIAQAASASAISAFSKTHRCKSIPNETTKTVLLLKNINIKHLHGGSARRSF